MTIYVVIGRNGMTQEVGPVGAATTRVGAEQIAADSEWKLDDSLICEVELTDSRTERDTSGG